ncbi:acetyl/propionyl-CoA carboxylase subunit alpha [Nocardioides mangrovicus]|uniref:Acetyl/propionyl-CoA carboxylase subunit alpha n=1 Tax=Nocardioides mangrovicus TaxID=2478913 RepID=A0A3L8P062_9ACTN|nr:biotin carboxylase N-terminal domain-containing protein [Nocardioides mangrovicus]RLV48193.1 acetyl/propionyl-CoA carboxylase subunit alpha [Nocardioides mangrovicus]
MIRRLLVANRGEIASRVFRTCRSLGISTVAVHSDPDAALPYVAEADHAVRLPGAAPAETYLRADLLIDAARRSGADAVHPGYGFLSESAEFAQAVIDAGLTWVGPPPSAIEAMGSKVGAKELMRAAGVPVLDAVEGEFPVLVKASAGGGGRGMRIVRSASSMEAELAAARAEAESAFGDGTVFVEPYVERGRHVEVQVWGDAGGNLSVLGSRDCSVQRRHQKVIEEAPALDLWGETEPQMFGAARRAAEAIGYRGVGTVEFLYDESADRFWFLEMNTRLQVEHPVTEMTTGLDLVALQIESAEPSRRALALVPNPRGHAIEVRLYAEDPAEDYRPQSGVLSAFDIPLEDGVRVDAGYAAGCEIATFYDAMLAKVVAHGPDRRSAARRLAGVLERARIHGVRTNRDLLVRVLRSEEFLDRPLSTAFLDSFDLAAPAPDPQPYAVAAALAIASAQAASRPTQRGIPVGWRNVPSQPQRTEFEGVAVEWWGTRDGFAVDGYDVVSASPTTVTLEHDGVRTSYEVAASTTTSYDVDGPEGHLRLERSPRFVDPADVVAPGSLLAPMPGTVVSVAVAAGDSVGAGQPVLVLEAMKMQHTVSAPADGVVAQLEVGPGSQVAAGEVLAVVESP